jgi:choice-of-anchor B domain-containing protein
MRQLILLFSLPFSLAIIAQDSLNVRHLANWDDPNVPFGVLGLFNRYNEVWGYARDGREYAIQGSTLGVHVIDVTDPASPVLVDHVPSNFSGEGVIHRDYKVYNDHLLATCDQGPSTLQIMDLQYLPDSVHVVYDSDALLTRAHNIQVDTVNARLYTCGGSTQFSVYSIADPADPVLLNDCEADVPWWGTTVGYVHDCFVRDNIVWTNDEDGLHVLDFTDADQPLLLGSLTSYPDQGYNHSGWMNDDNTLYVMADETHGSPLKFVDPEDLNDLEVISSVSSEVDTLSIIHNPFFKGNTVHVAYYHDGYWAWDMTDPQQPVLLGFYDMSQVPNNESYFGAWGVYPYLPSGNILVSDMQTGLWILQFTQPMSTEELPSSIDVRVHPTLTNGSITIQPLITSTGEMNVEVIDATGKIVRSVAAMRTVMDIDLIEINDGAYIVRVTSGDRVHTQRIIKTSAR